MSVGGIGGARGGDLQGLSGDGTAELHAAGGTSSAQAASAVRGTGTAVPANVSQAVMAFDHAHHANRNIPDLSYGGVVDGHKNTDGSWTVRVGSFPTSIMGPRPGAQPHDIVSYTFAKDGKVTKAAGGSGAAATGVAEANDCEKALTKKDTKAATDVARKAVEGLILGGLGFPRVNQSPKPEDVERLKAFFGEMAKDGKMDDLRKAVDAEEKKAIDHFGGRRPMDWYGPVAVMSAAVNSFGTAEVKKQWAAGAAGGGRNELEKIENALARGDSKAATETFLKTADGLYGPGRGRPSIPAHPDADKKAYFQALLANLQGAGKLDDLKKAVMAEEDRQMRDLGWKPGQTPPQARDWIGPKEVADTLVDAYGNAAEKKTWSKT